MSIVLATDSYSAFLFVLLLCCAYFRADGSCYYTDTDNFMIYGGYKNYLGHSKHVHGNVYVHPEWRAGSFGGNCGMCVQDVGISEVRKGYIGTLVRNYMVGCRRLGHNNIAFASW